MVVSVRKWVQRAKFIVLFVLFTYVLYQMLAAVSAWMQPDESRYRTPSGKSVKVFQQEAEDDGKLTMGDRLRRFYWYGEQ
ncbi:MAG: DUF4227 family protein [Paenibacillaceae bacterium]|nr:DUF4227 family protein [Paenibacillaceae bacterium]